MRFPVNFLLYLTSVGLLGQAGFNFYQASAKLGGQPPQKFWEQGQAEAQELLKRAKGKLAGAASWSYLSQEWWAKFKEANLTGKLPPPPPPPPGQGDEAKKPAVVQTPLESIIELVQLWYDGHSHGTAGSTHVVVRYKPEAQVEPPAEELRRRELARSGAASGGAVGPADIPAAQQAVREGAREGGGRRGGRGQGPATPLPASSPSSNEWIQYLQPGESLWGQYSNIKLVRVSADAEIAYFVRELPPGDGQEGSKPQEEALPKLMLGMSSQVYHALREVSRITGAVPPPAQAGQPAPGGGLAWIDTEETVRKDNVYHIGRNDAAKFGQDSDEQLAGVGLDNYVSSFDSKVRGVRVVNIDPQLAAKYGLAAGEVILAVNDVPVKNKSEAINAGRKMYDRGTRTFVIKILNTSGVVVDRTYQAPPDKR